MKDTKIDEQNKEKALGLEIKKLGEMETREVFYLNGEASGGLEKLVRWLSTSKKI